MSRERPPETLSRGLRDFLAVICDLTRADCTLEMTTDLPRITRVEPLSGIRLAVEFSDGVRGEVDLADDLWGPVFEPLKERALFEQVTVDSFGAICWPNGADLAPDALHARLVGTAAPTRP